MFGGRGSLRDVIRHEYAHALEHHYPRLTWRSARFRETFGEGGVDDFVLRYARTSPSEDFAETFIGFVRHGGRRPARFSGKTIRRKWAFVREVCRAIRRGKSVW